MTNQTYAQQCRHDLEKTGDVARLYDNVSRYTAKGYSFGDGSRLTKNSVSKALAIYADSKTSLSRVSVNEVEKLLRAIASI